MIATGRRYVVELYLAPFGGPNRSGLIRFSFLSRKRLRNPICTGVFFGSFWAVFNMAAITVTIVDGWEIEHQRQFNAKFEWLLHEHDRMSHPKELPSQLFNQWKKLDMRKQIPVPHRRLLLPFMLRMTTKPGSLHFKKERWNRVVKNFRTPIRSTSRL